MKKRKYLVIMMFMLILVFTLTDSVLSKSIKIILLHTNDMHGHIFPYENPDIVPSSETIGGFQYLATLIKNERKANPGKVILFDGGDIAQGSLYSNISYGIPMIELMNLLKYDGAVIGNHEFDWGEEKLRNMISSANFPFLSPNIINKKKGDFFEGARPYIIKDIEGIRIAIIGVACTDTSIIAAKSGTGNYYFYSGEEILKKYIPLVKYIHRADIIIILSHEGYEKDKAMALQVDGIDIIIGGHTHLPLYKPEIVKDTIILQAGKYMEYLGRLEFEYDMERKKITDFYGKLIKIEDNLIEPDKEINIVMENYRKKYETLALQEIGRASTDLTITKSRESNLANLIADIIRETSKADVGLINSGGIRENIPKGLITMEKIYRILPFDDLIVTMDLTGRDLENIMSCNFRQKHGILQVSGLKLKYNLSSPEAGQLISIMVGNKPVQPDAIYKVATIEFLADGGNNYEGFKNKKNLHKLVSLRDTVVEYFKNHSPLTGKIERRIEIIN